MQVCRIRSLSWFFVAVFVVARAGSGFADPPKNKDEKPAAASNVSAQAGTSPATLDEALARAMERNPDILTAQAKLRLAEAELNGARLETTRKIISLWNERQAQADVATEVNRAYTRFQEANARVAGTVNIETLANARIALVNAKAKLNQIESELQYLIGQAPVVVNSYRSVGSSQPIRIRTIQLPRGELVEIVRVALAKETPQDLSFRNVPLASVVEHLADAAKINFQLDSCIESNLSITISVRSLSLASAIQAIEDKYPDLKFVVRDYGILVTTPEHAEEEGFFSAVEFARQGKVMLMSRPSADPSYQKGR